MVICHHFLRALLFDINNFFSVYIFPSLNASIFLLSLFTITDWYLLHLSKFNRIDQIHKYQRIFPLVHFAFPQIFLADLQLFSTTSTIFKSIESNMIVCIQTNCGFKTNAVFVLINDMGIFKVLSLFLFFVIQSFLLNRSKPELQNNLLFTQ